MKMKITILTLFPQMISGFLGESILKRAQEKGAVEIDVVNIRDFAVDKHKTVDDRPFGGGAGMVLMAEPLIKAIASVKLGNSGKQKVILTSPRGIVYSQKKAQEYAGLDNLVIIAGHYEGFDERITNYIDEEISIGDYVLTGGELPAAIIVDSIIRLLPGVLKKEDATENESFFSVSIEELIEAVGSDDVLDQLREKGAKTVQLLEYPHYTRPQELAGKKVPEVLVAGDPKKIRVWQLKEAYSITKKNRPELLLRES
ncbi:tRNA (guanosine(37)-N1)-methyltransferase TrmD [Candidatus Roizmanbacteria bacterium RIFCSPHIGHO2_12_FULL_44_10]|uniref:tRNA (guanine-N(1)-)-methyltransferase n=1 Tax=Candidatus Roizmanbacteria bacterium RIFCSPHIGHO2_12_FULL_44_10 TaxID=1802054 RepID=A0A1F7IB05_9BACT|nr:MAG: tRNA (guanosine(37)-N1)-methyltransferase TrmD [Candidatus Roizmanbacteria bacterium RIFCSPHIGHO2_12_FULL_44_10]